jgi:hypothetical protein
MLWVSIVAVGRKCLQSNGIVIDQLHFNQFSSKSWSLNDVTYNFELHAILFRSSVIKRGRIFYRSSSSQRYVHDYRWVKSGGQIHGCPSSPNSGDALPPVNTLNTPLTVINAWLAYTRNGRLFACWNVSNKPACHPRRQHRSVKNCDLQHLHSPHGDINARSWPQAREKLSKIPLQPNFF